MLSNQERDQIAKAVADALTDDDALAGVGDLKDWFCKNWPTAKAVLEKGIVLGDKIQGIVCK